MNIKYKRIIFKIEIHQYQKRLDNDYNTRTSATFLRRIISKIYINGTVDFNFAR